MKKYLENLQNRSILNRKSNLFNRLRSPKLYMVVFAICTLLLSIGHSLHAATINVPADFITIQAAVDSAIAGDTVKVATGAYFESVIMKTGVDIDGVGVDFTIITSNDNPVTVIGADNATISGFLLTNTSKFSGIGFSSDNTSSTIINCKILKCTVAGISCKNNGSPVIKDNVIENNDIGISVSSLTGSISILNNKIFNNSAEGIRSSPNSSSTSTIKNNILYNNSIGIEIWGGKHDIINNTIYFNGRGITTVNTPTLTVINNIIMLNGNGVEADREEIVLSFNNVFGNSTDYSRVGPGFGDISVDPLFFDAPNGDFHFLAASPCIDVGNTTIADPDGSRSDMGAFGGPGTLENSTIFGPIVQDVIVSPNPVSQGQTVTIRASASVQ